MLRPDDRLAPVLLLIVAVIWLPVNRPVEGQTLIRFTAEHGLTVADLASVAAAGLVVRALRRQRSDSRRSGS